MSNENEQWAILELMGHRRLAGLVSEVERYGEKVCRIDIPKADGSFVTQFYGGKAIYCETPTTEDVARKIASFSQPRPVTPFELTAPEVRNVDDDEDPIGPDF